MNIQLREKPNQTDSILAVSKHFLSSDDGAFEVRFDGSKLTLASPAGVQIAQAALIRRQADLLLDDVVFEAGRQDQPQMLAALADAVFYRFPDAAQILLPPVEEVWPVITLATARTAEPVAGKLRTVLKRSVLRQLPLLWRKQASHLTYPAVETSIGPADRLPPLRSPRPNSVMYERWLPDLDLTLSFRPIDRRHDLDLFHEWMNDGRVSFFWELAQSREELDGYLAAQEQDPHIFGVIASLDGEPSGYLEFYWGKEDRLGPYYDPTDYDRGWHGLIGNKRHLGRPKTLALFHSVTHYLFLDDPRTQRIVGEPRASNHKMLSYCAHAAYDKVKEFDFPHKRAMFVCCQRERFFGEVPL